MPRMAMSCCRGDAKFVVAFERKTKSSFKVVRKIFDVNLNALLTKDDGNWHMGDDLEENSSPPPYLHIKISNVLWRRVLLWAVLVIWHIYLQIHKQLCTTQLIGCNFVFLSSLLGPVHASLSLSSYKATAPYAPYSWHCSCLIFMYLCLIKDFNVLTMFLTF